MNKFFVKMGAHYRLLNDEGFQVLRDGLPRGVYEIGSDMSGPFLEKVAMQAMPTKLYGNVRARAERVMNTFKDRQARGQGTGVMLYGEKGSGKSLLARLICTESDLPVLLVSGENTAEQVKEFLQFGSPCVVWIDEFEKAFDQDEQENFLSLLDGVSGSANLSIVTLNHIWKVSEAMQGRPSRFYYAYKYEGLEEAFIHEFAADVLVNKTQIEAMVEELAKYQPLNMDMLQAVVEELNRYGETPAEAIRHLNILQNHFSDKSVYQGEVTDKATGKQYPIKPLRIQGHLLAIDSLCVYWEYKDEDGDASHGGHVFEHEDLRSAKMGEFYFEDGAYSLVVRDIMPQTVVRDLLA